MGGGGGRDQICSAAAACNAVAFGMVCHAHGFATIIFGGRLFATRLYNFASLSAIVEVDAMKGIIDCFIFDRRGLPW